MRARLEARLALLQAELLRGLTVAEQLAAQQERLAREQANVAATVAGIRGAVAVMEELLGAGES